MFNAVQQPVEPLLEVLAAVEARLEEGFEVGELAAFQEHADVLLLQEAGVGALAAVLTGFMDDLSLVDPLRR